MVDREVISDCHRLEPDEAIRVLGSSPDGLTSEQAAAALIRDGRNVLPEQTGRPLILTFLAEFTSPMGVLLWAAVLISVVAGLPQLAVAIFGVNLINGVFSFWQEYRAERATAELKRMLTSTATVIRDGEVREISTEELVRSDLIVLVEGQRVGADARVVEANDLQVDQSTLSGESRSLHRSALAMHDDPPVTQRPNMVFAGTNVTSGDGRAVVTATGRYTEFGRIAHLTGSVQTRPSPLQRELAQLTRQLSILALGLGAFFVVIAVVFVGEPLTKSFIFGLGMVVAFIPEGLLPTVTLSLAMAVQRMARQNALVKKLSSVETLGCATVICSDKTGTITQNEMTVLRLWLPGADYEVTGRGYAPEGEIRLAGVPQDVGVNGGLRALLEAASLCNNASVRPPRPNQPEWTIHGDPTEACLQVVAMKAGIDVGGLGSDQPRVKELPFDTHRKRMSTIQRVGRATIATVKGAPQTLPPQCDWIMRHGVRVAMTEDDRREIAITNDELANQGLRVLAVAVRTLDSDLDPATLTVPDVERELTFLGLIAMEDPPREGLREAVEICHRASIRIIMITGDYGLTAEAIARSIGIVRGPDVRVISGAELDEVSEAELADQLRAEVIFARVTPEQKYRIVAALQDMGEIVAVTGDGVNDAPALKKADIGIAMGRTGTDVAKEAADMVITDDHFATIVQAIDEGRGVYENIRKFLTYILNSNMAEAAPSAAFLVSRGLIPLPMTVMQILTIDLGTDLLPALGLGAERPEDEVMDRPPRKRTERLLNRRVLWLAFGWYGLLEALFGLSGYFMVNWLNGWPAVPLADSGEVYARATTMTLAAIIFCQIGAVLNCRTESTSLFTVGLFSNRRVLFGIVAEIVLLAALSYVPILQRIFGTAPLELRDWLLLAFLPPVMIGLDELRKAVVRRSRASRIHP